MDGSAFRIPDRGWWIVVFRDAKGDIPRCPDGLLFLLTRAKKQVSRSTMVVRERTIWLRSK